MPRHPGASRVRSLRFLAQGRALDPPGSRHGREEESSRRTWRAEPRARSHHDGTQDSRSPQAESQSEQPAPHRCLATRRCTDARLRAGPWHHPAAPRARHRRHGQGWRRADHRRRASPRGRGREGGLEGGAGAGGYPQRYRDHQRPDERHHREPGSGGDGAGGQVAGHGEPGRGRLDRRRHRERARPHDAQHRPASASGAHLPAHAGPYGPGRHAAGERAARDRQRRDRRAVVRLEGEQAEAERAGRLA